MATPVQGNLLGDFPVGTLLKFNENGTPATFFVLQNGYPNSGDQRTIILRKTIYNTQAWNTQDINVPYETSTINTFLNGDYFNSFDEKVKSKIEAIDIPTILWVSSGNYTLGTASCKIFLLSFTEVGFTTANHYMQTIADGTKIPYFSGDSQRNFGAKWWLRSKTMYDDAGRIAWGVNSTNQYPSFASYPDESNGVLPALTLPNDTLFSLNPDSDGAYTPI